MWSGFIVKNVGEDWIWFPIEDLKRFHWVWTKENITGATLIFQDKLEDCMYCGKILYPAQGTYCSYYCQVKDCGCKASSYCCGFSS